MRKKRLANLIAGLCLLAVGACSERTADPTAITASVLPADSAARLEQLAMSATVEALVTSESMVLEAPGGFEIRLLDRECASPTNTVSVVSPDSALLSTTMCQEPIDTVWTFPGAYGAFSSIVLDFQSGVAGAVGAMHLNGSYPSWTVEFEDGYDSDFNDFVLSVTATVDTSQMMCDQVVRGQSASCHIVAAIDSVQGWRWIGRPFLTTADTIPETTSDTTWSGVALQSGTIEAFVYTGGTLDTLVTLLQVSDRTWGWSPTTDWSFVQGGAPTCSGDNTPFVTGGAPIIRLGRNGRVASCDLGSIDPNWSTMPAAGFSTADAPSGPNTGLWYVTSTSYRMDRGSRMNVTLTSSSPDTVVLQNGGEKAACRSNGIGAPYKVTFFDFNDVCKPAPLDSLYAGIWSHEGFGVLSLPDSLANGHERVRRINALANDPMPIVEAYVVTDSAALVNVVLTEVASDDAASHGDPNHIKVKNNFGCQNNKVWVWDINQARFFSRAVTDSLGNCI